MDAFVFTLNTEDLAAWTPRALDMIDAVLTQVEMVARNDTLRTVLERAHESGLHQKVICTSAVLSQQSRLENDIEPHFVSCLPAVGRVPVH